MIGRFRAWLDHRIGLTDLLQHALYEPIPSGARFRYVTGSVLVFAFITQAVTGIFLWMAYSPSSQTAHESVYYIQHEMAGGWLVLRGQSDVGTVVASLTGLTRIEGPWRDLVSFFRSASTVRVKYELLAGALAPRG